jgi:glucosamine--fructose-6-phosphate aminotransferase (isomerizing)
MLNNNNTRAHTHTHTGQLPGKVRRTLMLDSTMQELAQQLKGEHSLMFFARGYNYATALEAALKVKVCGVV